MHIHREYKDYEHKELWKWMISGRIQVRQSYLVIFRCFGIGRT